MPIIEQTLDSGAMGSLARLLATPVLLNIARMTPAHVVHGQVDSPRLARRKTFPPNSLCDGYHGLSRRKDSRYIYPGIATVLEGTLHVGIGDNLYRVHQGDWLILQPDAPHREFHLPSKAAYRLLWFQFPAPQSKLTTSQYGEKNGFRADSYFTLDRPPEQVSINADSILREPVQPIEILRGRLVHLVSWWLDMLTADPPPVILHSHPMVEFVLALLEDNEFLVAPLSKLAEEVGLSLKYISACFRRHTGQTLHQAVQEKRLSRARWYLAESNLSIKEIAIELGFADSQHFNHAFHRLMGISPSAYRERLRGEKTTDRESRQLTFSVPDPKKKECVRRSLSCKYRKKIFS